jgi:hypothetical protein
VRTPHRFENRVFPDSDGSFVNADPPQSVRFRKTIPQEGVSFDGVVRVDAEAILQEIQSTYHVNAGGVLWGHLWYHPPQERPQRCANLDVVRAPVVVLGEAQERHYCFPRLCSIEPGAHGAATLNACFRAPTASQFPRPHRDALQLDHGRKNALVSGRKGRAQRLTKTATRDGTHQRRIAVVGAEIARVVAHVNVPTRCACITHTVVFG